MLVLSAIPGSNSTFFLSLVCGVGNLGNRGPWLCAGSRAPLLPFQCGTQGENIGGNQTFYYKPQLKGKNSSMWEVGNH